MSILQDVGVVVIVVVLFPLRSSLLLLNSLCVGLEQERASVCVVSRKPFHYRPPQLHNGLHLLRIVGRDRIRRTHRRRRLKLVQLPLEVGNVALEHLDDLQVLHTGHEKKKNRYNGTTNPKERQ